MTRVQGMTIDGPEGWPDKSMLVLSAAPVCSASPPSFVVTREITPGDLSTDRTERLEVFADRQAEQMRDTLPGLDIERRPDPAVD